MLASSRVLAVWMRAAIVASIMTAVILPMVWAY